MLVLVLVPPHVIAGGLVGLRRTALLRTPCGTSWTPTGEGKVMVQSSVQYQRIRCTSVQEIERGSRTPIAFPQRRRLSMPVDSPSISLGPIVFPSYPILIGRSRELRAVTCPIALRAPTVRRSFSDRARAPEKNVAANGEPGYPAPQRTSPLSSPIAHDHLPPLCCSHAEGHPAYHLRREAGGPPPGQTERPDRPGLGQREPQGDSEAPRRRGQAARGGADSETRGFPPGPSRSEEGRGRCQGDVWHRHPEPAAAQ